jgi:hypothetical protein
VLQSRYPCKRALDRRRRTTYRVAASLRSQIRHSEIGDLFDKVRKEDYGRYLRRINIDSLRSITAQSISFDFPVTAIIGPNGGGKSSVLSAAAAVYDCMDPAKLFPRAAVGDKSMAAWSMKYTLIDKSIDRLSTIRRSVALDGNSWQRDGQAERQVLFLGAQRAVPVADLAGYEDLTKPTFSFAVDPKPLTPDVTRKIERILNDSFSSLSLAWIDSKRDFYMRNDGAAAFTEFHFGAGEASIARVVSAIEALDRNALVLIEEIENGLHPLAVHRLIEYITSVAIERSIQVIFTTHSERAIDSLPNRAIWSCLGGVLRQGRLDINSLKALAGRVPCRLAVFVEDEFAKRWVEKILSSYGQGRHHEIGVFACGGYANAVSIHENHGANPSIQFKSICLLDGDAPVAADLKRAIYKLPGGDPEDTVFRDVLTTLPGTEMQLKLACHLMSEATLEPIVQEVGRTNRDKHLLFAQLAESLGTSDANVLADGFIFVWCEHNVKIGQAISAEVISRMHDGKTEELLESKRARK